MRVVDKDDKTLDADKLDLTKGYLVDDKIFVKHHEAQEEIVEVSHYETVKIYSNGGKDIRKIIDIPHQEAKDAYDEYEYVQRYIEYTRTELDARHKSDAVEVVKGNLNSQISSVTQYLIAKLSTIVDDNNAEKFAGLFDVFQEKKEYPNKTILRYKSGLYRAAQDVPANYSTTPDMDDGKYFNRIGKPDANGVYSWLFPISIDQTYFNGDIVLWNGDEWKSDQNYNAYEPGVFGWTKYTA